MQRCGCDGALRKSAGGLTLNETSVVEMRMHVFCLEPVSVAALTMHDTDFMHMWSTPVQDTRAGCSVWHGRPIHSCLRPAAATARYRRLAHCCCLYCPTVRCCTMTDGTNTQTTTIHTHLCVCVYVCMCVHVCACTCVCVVDSRVESRSRIARLRTAEGAQEIRHMAVVGANAHVRTVARCCH